MKRKRSRSDTEKRFQDAVLELVAESGCAELGVNIVAQQAGADKVLIYRYFGNLEGLLTSVAQSRQWLPEIESLLENCPDSAPGVFRKLHREITRAIEEDRPSLQILRWRHAVKNPITEQFNSDWKSLWPELASVLSKGLSLRERNIWEKSFQLLAAMVAAALVNEKIDWEILEAFAAELEVASSIYIADPVGGEDVLPTNLL